MDSIGYTFSVKAPDFPKPLIDDCEIHALNHNPAVVDSPSLVFSVGDINIDNRARLRLPDFSSVFSPKFPSAWLPTVHEIPIVLIPVAALRNAGRVIGSIVFFPIKPPE